MYSVLNSLLRNIQANVLRSDGGSFGVAAHLRSGLRSDILLISLCTVHSKNIILHGASCMSLLQSTGGQVMRPRTVVGRIKYLTR